MLSCPRVPRNQLYSLKFCKYNKSAGALSISSFCCKNLKTDIYIYGILIYYILKMKNFLRILEIKHLRSFLCSMVIITIYLLNHADGFPVHILSSGLHQLSSLLPNLTVIFRMKALIVHFVKCQKSMKNVHHSFPKCKVIYSDFFAQQAG